MIGPGEAIRRPSWAGRIDHEAELGIVIGKAAKDLASPAAGEAHILGYVSRVMTLLPGDMITTGTPSGIGPLEAGDVVEVEIEGVGRLRNPVL